MSPALLLLGAALTLAVDPAELRPSPDASATVRVVAAVRPRLSVSVGTLGEPAEQTPGVWAARYTPPDEAVPQVAMLAAVAGGEVAFAALRLFGLGDAEVKTRRRGRITVTIGEEQFGPVEADARGIAEVPVVVPPGVAVAMHGSRPIDLHVPPTRTLHLALLQPEAAADRPMEVELRLFVVDPSGEPRVGARLVLQASAGALEAARDLGGGLYSARWSLPAGLEGTETARAFLEDAPRFVAEAALRRPAGPAATVSLAASRSQLVAGEPELLVEATLRDAAGNPAVDELRASASPGEAVVEPLGQGRARLHVKVPGPLFGATLLRLAASCAHGPATAALELPVSPAEPSAARLERAPEVRADGVGRVPVRMQVEDRFGNPVPAAALVADAQAGQLSAPVPLGRGAFESAYTPPLLREPGSALLRVRAGAAAADLRVPLAPSQQLLALTPKLGAVTNLGRITSPLAVLEAAVRLDRLGTQFAALVELGWFFDSHDDTLPVGTQPSAVHTHADYLALAAGFSWRPFVAEHLQGSMSVSPSLLFQRATQQFAGQPALAQGAVTPGVLLAAGLEYRFGRMVPLIEARYSWNKDPLLFTLQNPVRGFALVLGSRFELL